MCGDSRVQLAELSMVMMWDTGVKWHLLPLWTPLQKGGGGEDGVATLAERCYARGVVHHMRYSADGLMLVSVGIDGLVCFYDGTTMELNGRVANAHGSLSMYSC
jgi:hypothetical protein